MRVEVGGAAGAHLNGVRPGSGEETPNTKIQTPKKLQTPGSNACREPDYLRLNRCRHVSR